MTCHCKIREDYPDPDKVHLGVIVYCPLHANAGKMLAALTKYIKWAEDDRLRQKYSNPTQVRDYILDDARALLREIEEG